MSSYFSSVLINTSHYTCCNSYLAIIGIHHCIVTFHHLKVFYIFNCKCHIVLCNVQLYISASFLTLAPARVGATGDDDDDNVNGITVTFIVLFVVVAVLCIIFIAIIIFFVIKWKLGNDVDFEK